VSKDRPHGPCGEVPASKPRLGPARSRDCRACTRFHSIEWNKSLVPTVHRRRPTTETFPLPVGLTHQTRRAPPGRGRSSCVRGRTKLIALSAAGVLGLAALGTPMIANAAASPAARTLAVQASGARRDGNADDAAATTTAIAA